MKFMVSLVSMEIHIIPQHPPKKIKQCRFVVLRAFTDSTALMKVLSHGLDAQKFLPAVSLPSTSVRGDVLQLLDLNST